MDNTLLSQEIETLKQEIADIKSTRGFKGFLKKSFSKLNVLAGVGITVLLTSMVLFAATVTKPHGDFTDGTAISAAEVNDQINDLYTLINGNLDDDNISSIDASKITTGTLDAERLPSSVKRNYAYSRGTSDATAVTTGLTDADTFISPVTITTNGNPVRVSINASTYCGTNGTLFLSFEMDNASITSYMATEPTGTVLSLNYGAAAIHGTLAADYVLTGIPAGEHTFNVVYRIATDGRIYFSTSTLFVEELPY